MTNEISIIYYKYGALSYCLRYAGTLSKAEQYIADKRGAIHIIERSTYESEGEARAGELSDNAL